MTHFLINRNVKVENENVSHQIQKDVFQFK